MADIYFFSPTGCDWPTEAKSSLKALLGGKGAALVDMSLAGFPVPEGFTITTDVCNQYRVATDQNAFLDSVMDGVVSNLLRLSEIVGHSPLVSVRSGAPVSMPGMMDTILNVGLNEATMAFWIDQIGERAALDSYRRLIQMLGATAFDIAGSDFEEILTHVKATYSIAEDSDLQPAHLRTVIAAYKKLFVSATGKEFPDSTYEQLRYSVKAVFDSWMNPRAIHYRKINNLSDDMGTAVTVQRMVFGNTGNDSGTGVIFTRNPTDGTPVVLGEFLPNAQGEDVVAGIRTPLPLDDMLTLEIEHECFVTDTTLWAGIHGELMEVCSQLEAEYDDMVDIEFTVQMGKLFILQSRVGKRTALAAVRIAHDMVEEKTIPLAKALSRVTSEQFKVLRRPMIDPSFKTAETLLGLPACNGIVTGRPVYSVAEALACQEPCILVTHETTPDDIEGMSKSVGILTKTGGATSHAAVVARSMDKSCVVGCTALDLEKLKADKVDRITIDGGTGKVWVGIDVPVVDSSDNEYVRWFIDKCVPKNFVLNTNFPLANPLRRYCIQPQAWWGSHYILNVIMEHLNQHENLDHVLIDITNPHKLVNFEDGALLNMFGTSGIDPDFSSAITTHPLFATLVGKGLDITNGMDYSKGLRGSIDYAVLYFLGNKS